VYALRDAPWQVFGTFTFMNPLPVNREAEVLIRNTMRKACRMAHVHFESSWFLTRGEFGELGGRFHYHMLIGNFPPLARTTGFLMELRQYWRHFRKDHDGNRQQRHGDGAQVWPFDWALDGVKYVMKGVERYAYTGEAQNYELAKFGLSDRITLSAGLLRHVDWQVRRGVPKTVKTLRQGEHSGPATATHDAAQFLQVGGMAGVTSVNARRAAWCEQTAGLFVKVA
jgi:hypothetical protein